jgi:hypothetical protein
MKDQIEKAIQPLVGLPLWSMGRAGGLIWFAFGVERREVTTRKGSTKIVSEYSLHVQCPWRIRDHSRIFAGHGDRFYPSGDDPYRDFSENELDKIGNNQLDQRASKFMMDHEQSPLIVRFVKADEIGSISIILNQDYSLEIFPSSSLSTEYWRLFRPSSEEDHFVVTCNGVEIDQA